MFIFDDFILNLLTETFLQCEHRVMLSFRAMKKWKLVSSNTVNNFNILKLNTLNY